MSTYSISEYHDVDKVYREIKTLMSQPPLTMSKAVLDDYIKQIETKCPKSKVMTTEAKNYIPGGVQHNLAFNHPFPIVINKAEGPYLYDIDGNRYIDFIQAGGPTVLGSNPPVVREKCLELLNTCGPSTGLFHEYELKIAKLICDNIPSVDMFRMLNSGSESVIAAVRTARVITGKKKVIKVGGAYHGWMDQMVYGIRIPGSGRIESHGIPRAYTSHTQEVYPNDLGQLERTLMLNRFRGGTAAVILEPLGPESGTYPSQKGYNKAVRELCDKYGALLIFDEVVTAFRVGMSGAQGYFDITPDLTVFGKVVAGGYPSAGGLGGKREYMEYLAAGLGGGRKKQSKVGGTMAANPLSCVAGYYTLLEIQKQDACVKAGRAGDRLNKGLTEIMQRYNLPFVVYNQGSICHLESAGTLFIKLEYLKILKVLKEIKERKQFMEEMGAAYLAEGLITLAGSRIYTSMADTDEVIDDALDRFDRVFSKMKR